MKQFSLAVFSAFFLIASLSACRLDPGSLAGNDVKDPYYDDYHNPSRSCAYRHIEDGRYYTGTAYKYFSAYKLDDLSRWEVEKGLLKIRFTPYNDNGTKKFPTIKRLAYQYLQKYQAQVMRELSCRDVTDAQDKDRYRYYECAIAKKNDVIDRETFYFAHLALQFDGDEKAYDFTESIPSGGCTGSSREDIREVKLNGVVLPTLVPYEGPGT